MNITLTYTDPDAPGLVAELAAFARHNGHCTLLCTAGDPIPGLPLLPPDLTPTYRHYHPVYVTPWGDAERVRFTYAAHPTLYYHLLYQVTGDPRPAYTVPDLGAAVVQPLTGFTQVYQEDGRAEEYVFDAPVWMGKVPPPANHGRWDAAAVLRDVAHALMLDTVPVYPGTLFTEAVTGYPWLDTAGLPHPPAYLHNGEAQVALSGYAVDTARGTLLYASLVGHKTACRSIWGSLCTMHRRCLTLNAPLHRTSLTVLSSHNYATYSDGLDADTGLIRLLLIDRHAFSAHATEVAYLVLPQGLHAAEADRAFAARLSAVLPVGVLPKWGAPLRQAGLDRGLVRACTCGGDVACAYALDADTEWYTVITDLLQAGELTLPEHLT